MRGLFCGRSPGVLDPAEQGEGFPAGDLQVLRSVEVDEVDRLVQRLGDHDTPVAGQYIPDETGPQRVELS